MSRTARKKSSLGIYHILVQGLRGEKIFEQEECKNKYLEILQRYHSEGKVKVYAYCVLDNAVHLLIEEAEDTISIFMRRLGVSYVHWYNLNREHQGTLFRERYSSQAIENDVECMRIIRYIHQLPVRMKLTNRMSNYKWSSYNEYLMNNYRIDKESLLGQLGDWNYERYMRNSWEGAYLQERTPNYQKTDEEALSLIFQRLEGKTILDLHGMDKDEQKKMLAQMRYIDRISITQLARLTGIGKGIIQRLKPEDQGPVYLDENEEF